MKIYKTNEEVIKDIKNRVLTIQGDVKFYCSISIDADIIVIDGDINAQDIKAWNIKARDINAWDIKAQDIKAQDINALDIDAWDILYYAFCNVYESIKCTSIKARRNPSQEPVCLNGKLEIKNPKEVEEKLKGLKAI